MFASDKLIATSVFNSVFLAIYLHVGFVIQQNDVLRKFWQMREMSHELIHNSHTYIDIYSRTYSYSYMYIYNSSNFIRLSLACIWNSKKACECMSVCVCVKSYGGLFFTFFQLHKSSHTLLNFVASLSVFVLFVSSFEFFCLDFCIALCALEYLSIFVCSWQLASEMYSKYFVT